MGLGLSIADAIVRQHGGRIAVATTRGEGTVFSPYFPVSGKTLRGGNPETPTSGRGKGRVLVMDDDAMVRNMMAHALKLLGYDAVLADEGEAALARYAAAVETGNRFDAVILDLTVRGGWGGIKTIRALNEIDPGVKAILSASGHPDDPAVTRYRDEGFSAVLSKPCGLTDLDRALRGVMGMEIVSRL